MSVALGGCLFNGRWLAGLREDEALASRTDSDRKSAAIQEVKG